MQGLDGLFPIPVSIQVTARARARANWFNICKNNHLEGIMSGLFPIDLRSDTVTKPTPAMRKVMSEAEVGDDVFGEDPTVIRLQERVAELLGQRSGTLCSIRHHGQSSLFGGAYGARR